MTVVKFRSEYRCDTAMLSACSAGDWFDCNRVLDSPAATLLRLPISAYSTGYYLVILGLAGAMLLRPTRLRTIVRPILLWMGWIGLFVIAGLGLYAARVVGGFCSYCVVIYGLTVAIFFAAALMHPDGHRAGLMGLFEPRAPRRMGVLLLVTLAFLAMVSVQMVQYRRSATELMFDRKCVLNDGYLPETSLRTRAAKPTVQIAMFIDLACAHCRREFEFWQGFVAAHPDEYMLSIYHYAREGACVPPEFRGASIVAVQNYACLAAEAAECVERVWPDRGKGLEMVGALFALQDGPSPYFEDVSIVGAAHAIGLTEIPTNSHNHPFYRCLRDDETTAQIVEHAHFAMDEGLTTTPVTYMKFYGPDGQPLPRVVRIKGAKQYGNAERTLAEARAEAQGIREEPAEE